MANITTTSTIIPNEIGTTNIIRNVINLGGSSACDGGSKYCEEGYGLYFPCLKSITKGQNVCFDFYVTDTSIKDVVDLRDVDSISLNLTGAFGCPFGTFSYPDNISSLQFEEDKPIYSNNFGSLTRCHLDVIAREPIGEDSDEFTTLNEKENDYYSGDDVEVAAYDTPTHIFIGWAILTDEGYCEDEVWDDYIVSKDNIYRFTINSDTTLYALYRSRKSYSVYVDPKNRSSHYIVTYNNESYHISHREEENCNNEFEHIDNILEGYYIVVECVPNTSKIGGDSNDDYMYRFKQWKDGNTNRCRLFEVGKDTKKFEKGDRILLMSVCEGPVDVYELEESTLTCFDVFDEEGIHINTENSENRLYEFQGDEIITETYNTYITYDSEESVLYVNNGSFKILEDVPDGLKISIHAKAQDNCEIIVALNGVETRQLISQDEYMMYDFYFRNCNMSNITISTNGKCLIDMIEIFREDIKDKGKASLCLDSETTSNLPSGNLSVSGAIAVNGVAYGLPVTPIGEVNKLSKIIINNI